MISMMGSSTKFSIGFLLCLSLLLIYNTFPSSVIYAHGPETFKSLPSIKDVLNGPQPTNNALAPLQLNSNQPPSIPDVNTTTGWGTNPTADLANSRLATAAHENLPIANYSPNYTKDIDIPKLKLWGQNQTGWAIMFFKHEASLSHDLAIKIGNLLVYKDNVTAYMHLTELFNIYSKGQTTEGSAILSDIKTLTLNLQDEFTQAKSNQPRSLSFKKFLDNYTGTNLPLIKERLCQFKSL